MGAAKACIERGAAVSEDSLADLLSLASAQGLVRVPLSRVVSRPGFTAVVAVSSALHVVEVGAVGAVAEFERLLLVGLAAVHGFSRVSAHVRVMRPAHSAVFSAIVANTVDACAADVAIAVGVPVGCSLHRQAPAGCILGRLAHEIIERPAHLAVEAVFSAKIRILIC